MRKKIKLLELISVIPLIVGVVIIGWITYLNPSLTPTELLIGAWDKYLLATLFLALAFVILELSKIKE